MSENQEFNVTVGGNDYFVSTGLKSFYVATNATGKLVVLTESWGDCNPLVNLWNNWKYQTTYGAARASMEKKCIREAVELEIEAHIDFLMDEHLPEQ